METLPCQQINNPDPMTTRQPTIMGKSNCSSNTTIPRDIPKSKRVYLKGVTVEMEPLRIAFIKAA
jgi:hypothetical protein